MSWTLSGIQSGDLIVIVAAKLDHRWRKNNFANVKNSDPFELSLSLIGGH
jgi:hypothetical protein